MIAQNLGRLIEQAQNNLENGLQQVNLNQHQMGSMNNGSAIQSLSVLDDGRKHQAGSLPPVLKNQIQKNWTHGN